MKPVNNLCLKRYLMFMIQVMLWMTYTMIYKMQVLCLGVAEDTSYEMEGELCVEVIALVQKVYEEAHARMVDYH